MILFSKDKTDTYQVCASYMLIIQKNGKNLKLVNYRLCYDFTLFPFSSKIKMSFKSKPMELPISTLLGIFALN